MLVLETIEGLFTRHFQAPNACPRPKSRSDLVAVPGLIDPRISRTSHADTEFQGHAPLRIQLDRNRHWSTQFRYIGLLPVKTVTICVPVRAPRGIILSVKPGTGVSLRAPIVPKLGTHS